MSVIGSNVLAGASGQSAGGGGGGGGAAISRSLRFNASDSAYLSRTPSSAGNRKTWTWSSWLKRSKLGTDQTLFSADHGSGNRFVIQLNASDQLQVNWTTGTGGAYLLTTQVFRDPASFFHLVVSFDTSQSTAANRVKVYFNGSQITSFSNEQYPSQNTDYQVNNTVIHKIGYGAAYADFYLADVHFIDGQALAATDFGETNTDNLWVPKAYAGTYGTNGFHLDFADNSSNAALGTDTSGNSPANNWTVNNLSIGGRDYLAEGTVSGTFYTSVGGGVDKMFDGSPSSGSFSQSGTASFTFGGAAVVGSTSIKIRAFKGDASGANVLVNGTDISSLLNAQSSGGYSTVNVTSTLGGAPVTLASVAMVNAGGGSGNIAQIIVDDVVLTIGNPAANDSLLDTPTNGDTASDTGAGGEITGCYAVINPLGQSSNTPTISDGNLQMTLGAAQGTRLGTIGVSSGKYYFEVVFTASSAFDGMVGVASEQQQFTLGGYTGAYAYSWGYYHNGEKYNGGSSSYGASYGLNDVIGVAIDMDNQALYFSKNGVYQNSGDPTSGSSKTGAAFTNLSGTIFPCLNGYGGTQVVNFGARVFNTAAPSGYKCLNTANLPTPTIADGSQYFDAKLYTGDNNSTQDITGYNFSPDLVWQKIRSQAGDNALTDTVRGVNAGYLISDKTDTEKGNANDGVSAFLSNGFTAKGGFNNNGLSWVAWGWDAGSSTVSNTDGDITSQVRASTSSGFSVVSYTGRGGGRTHIGHGLSSAPGLVIVKRRDAVDDWPTYFLSHTTFFLNTNANVTNNDQFHDGDYKPTSTVFTVGGNGAVNANGGTYIAYCMSSVEGYSKIATFQGNASTDGSFVYTGFKPRFLLIKRFGTKSWQIIDTARSSFNVTDDRLFPDDNGAESSGSNFNLDILSNGFKCRSSHDSTNASGAYAYYAVAEHPFASNGGLAR